jgi:hypothetical protein
MPPRESARRIYQETAVAAVAMAETTETRLTRLESDVAHISSDVADIKIDVREIRKDLGGLRDEMHRDLGGLRDEMREEFSALHRELAANSKAIVQGDLKTRIWMLLLCAAMLGVVARGLHWL